jgi:hypothetical protein
MRAFFTLIEVLLSIWIISILKVPDTSDDLIAKVFIIGTWVVFLLGLIYWYMLPVLKKRDERNT